mgnify:CR=1 FL=1
MKTHQEDSGNSLGCVFTEPRLISAKLDSKGILHFTTLMEIAAFEVLVSSGGLVLSFSKDDLEHGSNSYKIDITETGNLSLNALAKRNRSKDLVLMIRVKSAPHRAWTRWFEEIDVSEFNSEQDISHSINPAANQLAFRPATVEPVNGNGGVKRNGDQPQWLRFGRRSIRALVVKAKRTLKLWPGLNGHRVIQQTTTPNERHDNMKAKTKPQPQANMPEVTFPSTSISIMPMSGVTAYKIEFLCEAKVIGELTVGVMSETGPTVMENFVKNTKWTPGHPSKDGTYTLNVSAMKGTELFGIPGVWGFTGTQIVTAFEKGTENVSAEAAKPAEESNTAPASAAPAAVAPKAAPAKAPVAAKPLGREQLEDIMWLLHWIKSLVTEVSQAKESGRITEKFLKEVSAGLNSIDAEIAKLEIFAGDNVKVTELKNKAKELQEKLLELGKIWREKEAERKQLQNARIAPAAEAPAQPRKPAAAPEPAKVPVAERQERVQERPVIELEEVKPTKVVLPAGMADIDDKTGKRPEQRATTASVTPTKNWWYRWGRKVAVALTIIGVLVGLITNDKFMRWLGWGKQDVVAHGDDFKRTPAEDSDTQPAGPSSAYASVDAGGTNKFVAMTKHSSDGRVNVAIAVGNISGSNNIPITINAGGGEQTQEARKPKWYELEPSARVDLTPRFHGEQLTYVIPVGENWLFRVPEGWTSVTVKSAYVSQLDYEVATTDNRLPYGAQSNGDHIRYLNKMHSEMTITFQCFQVSRVQQQHGKPGLVPRLFHKVF